MSKNTPQKQPDVEQHHESSSTPPTPEPAGSDWKPGKAEWLILLCLALLSLIVSLDATILVPVLPSMAKSLHGRATETFWTGTSYLLTSAIFQPFIMSLSDSFGRRQLLFGSVAFFAAGTLICSLSRDFTTMLAGRSLQGVGGGGMHSLSLVITTDIVPLRQRPKYYSIVQLAWAFGATAGPAIGGAFAEYSTWRWAFYINFPFVAVGLVMVPWTVRLRAERASLRERLVHTDWMGAVLFISSSCSFLIGITWGGNQYAWDSWRTIVPIVMGVCGLVATFAYERYWAPQPFIKLWLFQDVAALAAYFCAVLQGLMMFCLLYYLPMYLEAVKGLSPTVSGAGLAPIIGGLLPTSIVVGALITRTGRYRWAIWSGWGSIIVSTALLIILYHDTPTYAWVLLFVAIGPGQGLVLTSLNFSLQVLAKESDAGYAAAMYSFMRAFGMCLGVAIGGTVLQNRLAVHLASRSLEVGVASNASAFILAMKSMPPSPLLVSYREAYAEAFRNCFEVLLAIAVLGALASLLIRHESMDRDLVSEHVLSKMVDEEAKQTRSVSEDEAK